MPPTAKFEDWLKLDGAGLCCAPGGFHVDPTRPVERAIITHGHSDHARPGHGAVLATPETIAIMRARLGPEAAGSFQALRYGETIGMGGVTVRLVPAGHILGSAQVVIEHRGPPRRRSPATTSAAPIRPRRPSSWCAATCSSPRRRSACRCSATSPTRARSAACSPRSRHSPSARISSAPTGSARRQRLIALLRAAGYDRPIWLHGALAAMCELYARARRRSRRSWRWSATRRASCRARSCSARRRRCRIAGRGG